MKSNLTPENKGKIGVYLVHNQETGEGYIGSGILGARHKEHERALKGQRHHNPRLQQAYNRHPHFDFVGVVVGEGTKEDRQEAYEVEQSFIDFHWGDPKFLNRARRVDVPEAVYELTPEQTDKQRAITTARWQDPEWRERVLEAQAVGKAQMTSEQIETRNQRVTTSLKEAYASGTRVSTAGQVRDQEFCQRNREIMIELWKDPAFQEAHRLGRVGLQQPTKWKPVEGDGVVYPSLTEAAKTLGITKQGMKYRIESDNFPGWKYQSIETP